MVSVRTAMAVCLAALGCGRIGFAPADDVAPGPVDAAGQLDAPASPACLASETAGPYTTDFAQGVPAWASIYQTAPAAMDIDIGSLRGRPGVTAARAMAGFELTVGDYRNRRVFVDVPVMVNTMGCGEVALAIADDDIVDEYVEISQSCGILEFSRWSGTTQSPIASISYDPVAHRWWQLRMRGGALHGEVSPDGVTWTELGNAAVPAYFDDVFLELSVGTSQLESAQIGEARFDNLTDCL